ncbi:hypothetical protein [Mycolicibacterium sp. 624]|uniref:hypothetical protein n=1 Tax=Mycolicibacterium sp. 624 TaxID=3156314 RepID=UPI00339611E0
MSTTSLILFYVGIGLLVAGIVVPGWDTNRLPKRAVKRRIYWTATAVAIPVLFIAGYRIFRVRSRSSRWRWSSWSGGRTSAHRTSRSAGRSGPRTRPTVGRTRLRGVRGRSRLNTLVVKQIDAADVEANKTA